MTRHNFISALILLLAMATPAAVMAQSAITAGQVAAAMSSAGLNTSAKQIVLLTDVVATTSTPALKVESMEQWGDRGMKARLSCAQPEECLPFFVAIRGSQAQAVPPYVADHSSAAILRAKSDSNSFVVRAGSRETLMLDGGHVHIQLSVVCLENGAVGQTIRVASLDHKQTYTAEVSSNKLLRGRLQ
jgi:Chaperone for flagella basal body P-ring formation